MSNGKILFVFLFILFGSFLQGQVRKEKVSLEKVLGQLEERFSWQFNYAVETIEGILLTAPSRNWSSEKTMPYLEKETGLEFTILPDNFITIEPNASFLACGHIKDAITRKPIVFTLIFTEHASAISDGSGYFELKIHSKEEEIHIQHLGYKKIDRSYSLLNKDICSDIFLNQQIHELSEVVLTNFLTEGINKMSDGSFEIDFSDFGILPGLIESDALQTVQALPGIQSVNETVSNINIRGGSNDQNLLMWDGIKMYQSGHFFGLVSIFNPMLTPKARLIKNGSQVDYTDGVSGTINMETDNTVNTEFSGSLGLNFISAFGFTDIPLGKDSSIQIAARSSLANLIKTPTYHAYVNRILQGTDILNEIENVGDSDIEVEFYDIGLRWLWDIDAKNSIRINFINVRNEFDIKESITVNGIMEERSNYLFQNSLGAGLFYKRKWDSTFETTLQIYGTNYDLNGLNSDIFTGQSVAQENRVAETGVKLNTLIRLGNRSKLLNGYQFTETQTMDVDNVNNPLFVLKISEVLHTHGLYSQFDHSSPDGRTNFSVGARLNYIDEFDKYILEPRINFNKKLLKYLTLEVLGEYKHQVTSQIINFQNDFLGIEKRRWQLANDTDIPIIKSKQASVGLHLNKGGWLLSGEGYYKFVSGITTQSQGFQNQYEFSKTDGSYSAYGFDFLVRKKTDRFNTWLSYSFIENHYNFDSLSESSFPNNLEITNAVTLGSSYSINDFQVSAGFNWHTGKPTTRPVQGNEIQNGAINYDTANSSRLKDYFRVDLSTTYKMALNNKINAHLGFSIWNILNRKNIIGSYYLINSSGVPVEVIKTSLEITPNISLRISF